MNKLHSKTKLGLNKLTPLLIILSSVFFLVMTPANAADLQDGLGSNTQPVSFGPDQTIIDLNKLSWKPLKLKGFAPGPEIATLRGDTKNAESLEAVVRTPANYTVPNHSHTSDELYLWLKGELTYIASDGTTVPLSGQSYISLPGSVPHALVCGDEPCLFYLHYTRPFDSTIYPMPDLKK